MSKLAMAAIAVWPTAALALPTSGAEARPAAQPSGLTNYGRTVWNLDALLRDMFGSRRVYLNSRQTWPKTPRNFSVTFTNNAHSAQYLFTFADAQASEFRAVRPTRRPKPFIGASGGEVPLTVRGAYIDCGKGTWLYEHYGNGPTNWQISCHR